MKKTLLLCAMFATLLTSCNKNNDDQPDVPAAEVEHSLDATSYTTWHYIDLSTNKVIASSDDDNYQVPTEMKNSTQWDIAICRYQIRTNSGASTTNGKGGLYTYTNGATITDVTELPSSLSWVADISVEQPQMSGDPLTYSISTAVVSVMEGGMPPTWVKSPLYLVKSGDGAEVYVVDMMSYKDDTGTSGYVKFKHKLVK